jgi:hypothetical protein
LDSISTPVAALNGEVLQPHHKNGEDLSGR